MMAVADPFIVVGSSLSQGVVNGVVKSSEYKSTVSIQHEGKQQHIRQHHSMQTAPFNADSTIQSRQHHSMQTAPFNTDSTIQCTPFL